MKRKLLLPIVAALLPLFSCAQQAQWFTQTGSANTAVCLAVATDASGCVYSAGFFTGIADFGFGPVVSYGMKDMFILKQDPSGNSTWARAYGGALDEEIRSLSISDDGTLYAAGNIRSSLINFGNAVMLADTHPQTEDAFLLALDLNGSVSWGRQSHGSGDESTNGVAVLPSHGACIVGDYADTAMFDSISLPNYGNRDIFIAEFDATGACVSADHAGGAYDDAAYGVAVDSSGSVYMTGYCNFGPAQSASVHFGNSLLSVSGYTDIFAADYDASLDCIWVRGAGGPSMDDEAFGIAVAQGKVFITGLFSGQIFFGMDTITTLATADAFALAYDDAGQELWAVQLGSVPSGTSVGWGIAAGDDGNPVITGAFEDSAVNPKYLLVSRGDYDMFALKLDKNDGDPLWFDSGGGTDEDWGTSIACDSNGDVYVAGTFASAIMHVDALSGTTASGVMDGFVAKYAVATGTAEIGEPIMLLAYPNPFTDRITVEYSGHGSYDALLANALGQEIRHMQSDGNGTLVIDRDGLPSGLYVVSLSRDGILVGVIELCAQ